MLSHERKIVKNVLKCHVLLPNERVFIFFVLASRLPLNSHLQRWEIISYHTKSVEQIVYAKIVIFAH